MNTKEAMSLYAAQESAEEEKAAITAARGVLFCALYGAGIWSAAILLACWLWG